MSSVINPKGTARATHLSRTDEYVFFAYFGDFAVAGVGEESGASEVRWRYLRRTDVESRRGTSKGGRFQFYPIYVNEKSRQIECIGELIPHGVDRNTAPNRSGCISVFPIREADGMEMNRGLTGPSLQRALNEGFVRCSNTESKVQPFVFQYLTAPNIKKIATGDLEVSGVRQDGSNIVVLPAGKVSRPTTAWRQTSHDAGAYGTSMLRFLIPGRKFPFPKSLYAVEDALRLATLDKPQALILDFFSGSGTTAHAVMRLNKQDDGRRKSISVTNNEVSAEEQAHLRTKGLRPGDEDWEALGICEYVTKPRITAAITGKTPQGEPVNGEYKFLDEFPMSEGFNENAIFFTMTYEAPLSVRHNRAFKRIAPMLWLRAGSHGRIITSLGDPGWDVADTYAVLENLDRAEDFVAAVRKSDGVGAVFIITDDESAFQMVCRELPETAVPVRLYESYLQNFEINMGRNL